MTERTLASIHQVESGIDISREFPLEKINHDAAGRRGLDIALANRRCGIHYDYVLSRPRRFYRNLLCHKL